MICLSNELAATDQRLIALDGSGGAAYRAAGQVVEVRAGGERAYFVIASPLAHSPSLELLVRAGRGGVADAVAEATQGGELDVAGPMGNGFALAPASSSGSRVVVCVTGTGIGAARPLLYALAQKRGSLEGVSLLYGVRTAAHVAFRDEIDAFVRRGLDLRLCLSDARAQGEAERSGWVQHVLGDERMDLEGAVVYAAGHREMMEELRSVCAKAGLRGETFLTNF